MSEDGIDWGALRGVAKTARERAHAPYSNYLVGAALLDAQGGVHAGCNVENASYGLCLCAERTAIARAVADGRTRFVAILVLTGGAEPGTPCGMCRQVMAEFPPDFAVRCESVDAPERAITTTVSALLPFGFSGDHLD